jgi:hypothetical protein
MRHVHSPFSEEKTVRTFHGSRATKGSSIGAQTCLVRKSRPAHPTKISFKNLYYEPAGHLSWEPNGSPGTNSYHHPQAFAFCSLVGSLVRGMLGSGSHTQPVSPLGLALCAQQSRVGYALHSFPGLTPRRIVLSPFLGMVLAVWL